MITFLCSSAAQCIHTIRRCSNNKCLTMRLHQRPLSSSKGSGSGSGRIVVNPPSLSQPIASPRHKRLIKTNLEQHFQYLRSQRLDPSAPPPSAVDASGVVTRDLTDDMISLTDAYDPRIHLPNAPRNWQGYEEATPLSQELIAYMAVRGQPMTVAEYMRQALTHELFGYYTNPTKMDDDDWDDDTGNEQVDSDDDWDLDDPTTTTPDDYIIGRKGDFVTAPEVSQVFGECLAVWFVTQFDAAITASMQDIQLVEVGPGKGTLMHDVLRSCCTLSSSMGTAIRHVHLVEASPAMRQEQQRKLESMDLPNGAKIVFDQRQHDEKDDEPPLATKDTKSVDDDNAIHVHWHATFTDFVATSSNNGMPTFVMCQEFIDALPVHVFEKGKEGWRERMVDVAIAEDDEEKSDVKKEEKADAKEEKKTRLRIVVSPDLSPACKTLLTIDDKGEMEHDASPVGQVCEVCPEGILLVQDIAKVVEKNGGAALIVDYGQEGSTDSLRGFSRHKQVNFLTKPGLVDVTADVDFESLRHAVNHHNNEAKSPKSSSTTETSAFAFGPVTQGNFLTSMGVVERVVALIEDENTTDEEAEDLYNALERLILPEQMGERYKVLAIARKKDGIFEPPGFS